MILDCYKTKLLFTYPLSGDLQGSMGTTGIYIHMYVYENVEPTIANIYMKSWKN